MRTDLYRSRAGPKSVVRIPIDSAMELTNHPIDEHDAKQYDPQPGNIE
ncbi:hypothetical protein [Spirosoma sp. KNUC1025]|nr:hypothetical protein LN737_09825 [Spirosoma sp. KNUC1025]